MGKTLKVVAKTLEVISGFDPDDKATYLIPDDFDFNFLEVTNNKRLDGIRFGLLNADNQTPQLIELHKEIKSIVKKLGGEVIDINDNRIYPNEAEYFILLYEFRVGLQKYLETSSSSMTNLEDVIKFNEENKNTVMPHFAQDIFFKSLESDSYIRYMWSKYKVRNSYKETLRLLEEYDLDAFIGLTRGPAWKINYDGGDWPAMQETLRFSSGGFAAHNGMPHITIPFFNIDSFPVGVSIIGKRWDDRKIFKLASAIDSQKS
jgi:Asp-tRNA(Asn)/Glu-tRNA(Gln) amidotransferase A subunit family amidase